MKTAILTIILALVLVASCATNVPEQSNTEPIEIGVIYPYTGEAAELGVDLRKILDLATEEINTAGGANGRELVLIHEDGKCTGKEAATAAQKLINVDGVKLLTTGCSGETLGAAPFAEQNKVILFSAVSGSPDITNSGDYIFRNFPSDATSGSKVAEEAIKNGHTTMVMLVELNDYSQAMGRVFKETYEAAGGTVLMQEDFESDNKDFKTTIQKMLADNPDGFFIVTSATEAYGLAVKQLRESGSDIQLYSNEWAGTPGVLEEYGAQVEGAIYAEPYFDESTPEVQEFFGKIEAKYGEVPTSLPPVYWALAYDMMYILRDATAECGEDTDCIKTFLYGIQDRSVLVGSLSIDENGDPNFEYIVKTIKNGKPAEYQG